MKENIQRKFILRFFLCMLVFIVTLALFLAPVFGSPSRAGAPSLANAGVASGDPEAFFDHIMAGSMEAYEVPGAAIVMVQDGLVIFQKGYGLANVEQGTPVVPDRTLFRIGSATKPMVATAIMQLVQAGRLDLQEDVNPDLRSFHLEETYPSPVTPAHLLTHTGGFDEREMGMHYQFPTEAMPLDQYMAENMPARVMPPGEVSSYSNSGYALLGLLIEEISGQRLEDYMGDRLFTPLGMGNSTFGDPPHLTPDLATGYFATPNGLQEIPYDYIYLYPAGGMKTTVSDMASWMMAILDGGRLGEAHILDEETVTLMLGRQFSHHPALPGWTYGFYERYWNGYRVLKHGGNYMGFMSNIILLPEEKVGLFYTYNQNDRRLYRELEEAFLAWQLPYAASPAENLAPPAEVPQYYSQLAGSYRHNRYARSTLEKLQAFGQEWRVSVAEDHALVLQQPYLGGEATRWIEVQPYLFREESGDHYIAFRPDENGKITHLFLGFTGHSGACERLSFLETTPAHLGILGAGLLGFLGVGVIWPVCRLIRRRRLLPETAIFAWARRLAILLSLLNLGFLGAMLIIVSGASMYGFPSGTSTLLLFPLIPVALTVGLGFLLFPVWRVSGLAKGRRNWRLSGRLGFTLFVLLSAAYLWVLDYWNLIASMM